MNMTTKKALLLVGHGSKLPYSKEFMINILEKLKKKNIFSGNVYVGLMEFNHPTIPESLKEIISSGFKKIIVLPVFLAHGTHTKKDIPKILQLNSNNIENHEEIHSHHSHHISNEKIEIPNDVEIIYKDPIGPHDKIIDILLEKINSDM